VWLHFAAVKHKQRLPLFWLVGLSPSRNMPARKGIGDVSNQNRLGLDKSCARTHTVYVHE